MSLLDRLDAARRILTTVPGLKGLDDSDLSVNRFGAVLEITITIRDADLDERLAQVVGHYGPDATRYTRIPRAYVVINSRTTLIVRDAS